MKNICLCLICIGYISFTHAQKISGIVKSNDSVVLGNTSVSLLNATSLRINKFAITNTKGEFIFQDVVSGKYVINISSVGFKNFSSLPITVSNADEIKMPTIFLQKKSTGLKEIIIKSQKPLIEIKVDRMIVNVDGTINAVGTDALELIRKSPGVAVDKDDNISMSGKSGVQIFVDGKPSPLAGEDLSNYLKSVQSTQIEALELITNPSAKYESTGNAGIINIRLIKTKTIGTNGSVNMGYAIGTYGKYNGGLALNHRNKKSNFFGNYNLSHSLNTTDFRVDREQLDTLFDLRTIRKALNTIHGFKVGADFFIDKRSTIGFFANGNISTIAPNSYSTTPITYVPNGVVNKILVSDNMQKGYDKNININGNYKYSGKKQTQLNIDFDYGRFNIKRNLYQPNIYYDTMGAELSRAIYKFVSIAKIDIFSIKIDYVHPLKKGILEYGIKSSYVQSNNNFERYNLFYSLWHHTELDTTKSNQFNYKEYINAAYINYNRSWKNVQLQVGLRAENTNSHGRSYPIKSTGEVNYDVVTAFTRNYLNLFPSLSLTFNKNPEMLWNISMGRRVDRPNYHDLNPFEYKLDEYTFRKGNTELLPQFSDNISIINTYKSKLISKLSFSLVNNLLGEIVDTVDRSKNYLTIKNIAQQKLFSLFESYNLQKKWYSGIFNANIFYTTFNADFGGGNRIIDTKILSYILSMQNSFKLGKDWTAELSAYFNSPTYIGTIRSNSIGNVDIGMQKKVLKGRGNFKMAITDIFLQA